MQTLLNYCSHKIAKGVNSKLLAKFSYVAIYTLVALMMLSPSAWAMTDMAADMAKDNAKSAWDAITDMDLAPDINNILGNIVNSFKNLPSLIGAIAFLGGLLYATTGVLKLKNHVDNPQQNPLTSATGRLIIGGALVSLPVIYSALQQAVIGADSGNLSFEMDDALSATGILDMILGSASTLLGDLGITRDVNAMLNAIIESISRLPSFMTVMGYLLGLYLGALGLLKLREHIEDPDRNPLKEATIRLFIGACFLSLPAIYSAMTNLVTGGSGSGLLSFVDDVLDASGFVSTTYKDGDGEHACIDDLLSGLASSATAGFYDPSKGTSGIGTAMCQMYGHIALLPSFLMLMARLFGFYLGFMALLKLRDHVLNPQQNPLSQAVTRFIAGGALISLNVIKDIIKSTVTPAASTGSALLADTINGYNVVLAGGGCGMFGQGLAGGGSVDSFVNEATSKVSDQISNLVNGDTEDASTSTSELQDNSMAHTVYCAVTDVMGPLHVLLNFFTFAAGIAFLMIGISRLLKSEQEGAKGPAGLGTISTFIVAGVLMSFTDFLRIATMTIFGENTTKTFVNVTDVTGLNPSEAASVEGILTAILKFMIMVGMVSFVRGVFMIRSVAEGGNQQASMMAAITHIVAGTIAINLGGFITLVQVTLGIDDFAGALKFSP